MNLIRLARRHVPPDRAVDTLDVILEVLLYPDDTGEAGEVLARALEPGARDALVADLRRSTAMVPRSGPGSEMSARLRRCHDAWTAEADRQREPAGSVLIVQTILERDEEIQRVLARHDIDRRALLERLDHLGRRDFATSGVHADSWDDVAAVEIAREIVRPGRESPYHRYAALQSHAVNHALNLLCEHLHEYALVVCAGRRGTLVENIETVLADRYASHTPFLWGQTALNSFKSVRTLDVRELLGREEIDGEVDRVHVPAVRILRAALRQALAESAILLVDHLEVLMDGSPQPTSHTREAMRKQIANRGATCVLGIYHVRPAESNVDALGAAKLGQMNVKAALIAPYVLEETQELLTSFCYPRWQADGFTFTGDAFAGALDLAADFPLDDEPIALPGIALLLAERTIETAREGHDRQRATAKHALSVLERRRHQPRDKSREKSPGRHKNGQEGSGVQVTPVANTAAGNRATEVRMRAAYDDIKRLIATLDGRAPQRQGGWWFVSGLFAAEPSPDPSEGKHTNGKHANGRSMIELTGAHLKAQLLCDYDESVSGAALGVAGAGTTDSPKGHPPEFGLGRRPSDGRRAATA
jgi:hypothetical protein